MSKSQEKNAGSESQNWLVTNEGKCVTAEVDDLELPENPYRLYRFLTDLEDILDTIPDDYSRIWAIAPLVRKLLTSSSWLQMEFTYPAPDPGWSVRFLYQEHNYPITVQMVAWLPSHISPIHNHATWGIVAIISGQEKNQFWRRSPTPKYPDQVELVGDRIFVPGDIIGFMPHAIHSVEPIGDEPVITFNLYGVTDYSQRFEFDPINHSAKNF
jgi:predicted metal-dependent enzyme (double-stranded beta helix superfamily)